MKFLSVIIVFFLCNTSLVIGQVNGVSSNTLSSNLESKSLIVLYTNKASLEKVNALKLKKEELSSEMLFLKAKEYDDNVMEGFGSYVNPYTNSLQIAPPKDKDYTKAQLVNINTGITVFKKDLKNGGNAIDLSDVAKGTYVLIMTDAARNIHTEEFLIH